VPAWVTSPQDFQDDPERLEALARQHGVPLIQLRDQPLNRDVLKLVPKGVAYRHKLIPVSQTQGTLTIALSDPANVNAIDDITFLMGSPVKVAVASPREIEAALERGYTDDVGPVLAGEPIYEEP
jgi:type II secretion system (T2SS) protein E